MVEIKVGQWSQERLPLPPLDRGKERIGFLSSELDLDLAEQTGLVPGEEETPEFAQLERGRAKSARCCSWVLPAQEAQPTTWAPSCCMRRKTPKVLPAG